MTKIVIAAACLLGLAACTTYERDVSLVPSYERLTTTTTTTTTTPEGTVIQRQDTTTPGAAWVPF